jgi:hypothetical protein
VKKAIAGFVFAAFASGMVAAQVTLDFTGTDNSAGPNNVRTFYQGTRGITFSSSVLVWNTALYNPGVPNSDFAYVDPNDANCATKTKTTCLSLKAPFSNNVVLQGIAGGPRQFIMNVPGGLTGFLSLKTEGSYGSSRVYIYSGQNGTGTLINTMYIPGSGAPARGGVLKVWSNEIALDPTFRVNFKGVAHSLVFDQGAGPGSSTGSGYIEYDNISFN